MSRVEYACMVGFFAGALFGWVIARSDWRGILGYSDKEFNERYPND